MVRDATISVKNDDVVLLVGTMKGLFLFRSNAARRRWDVGGPFFRRSRRRGRARGATKRSRP
jgi:hypothetical protein